MGMSKKNNRPHGGWPQTIEKVGCGFLVFIVLMFYMFHRRLFDILEKLIS